MSKRVSVAAILLVHAAWMPLHAQMERPSTKGFFIGGHVITAPGFELSYIAGDYSGSGFTRHISEADAPIGKTSFAGGMRAVGGWYFNRYVALLGGFDIMGGKFKFSSGASEGSSQMSIFSGLRLNLPLSNSPITPYAFGTVGALSLTSKGDVDLYCGTMSGCSPAGSEWNGGYVGFGGGLELGASRAGPGHWVFDVHVETLRASIGADEGANEQYVTSTPLRFAIGMVWRHRR